MSELYWLRRLLVSAFEKDHKRKRLAKNEVNYHWPFPVPEGCKCTAPVPEGGKCAAAPPNQEGKEG